MIFRVCALCDDEPQFLVRMKELAEELSESANFLFCLRQTARTLMIDSGDMAGNRGIALR